jgi:excisionase family DNA binding protein
MTASNGPAEQKNSVFLSDQPEFLTVLQASKLLRVSTWAVYQVIRSGELPVIRWGRRVVLQREDLTDFLNSRRDAGLTAPPQVLVRRKAAN